MAEGSANGGSQTAVNGNCPEGYIHVFGPLCVEQTTLSRFEEALPEMPEFDFTNPGCEAALAALNEVIQAIEDALQTPRKLMAMARELLEKPFDAAKSMVDSALGVLDDLKAMIDDLLAGPGSLINDFKRALESLLDCPIIADTPIGKIAAAILDAMNNGLPYDQLLSEFKNKLSSVAKGFIDKIKEMPLSKLNDLERLFDEIIERTGVGDLLKKARELEQCVRAVCNMVEVAARVPETVETIIEEIGGKWDEASGKFTAILVKPATETAQKAKEVADSLTVIKLAGSG